MSAQQFGIVVGVDGSPSSTVAVEWAARDAEIRDVPLHLVHVVAPAVTPIEPWVDPSSPSSFPRHQEQQARRIVEEARGVAVAATSSDRASQITGEVLYAPVVSALVDLSGRAEMIVVGCRGQGAVTHFLLGSVSSGLVHHAHCPVGVIHDEEPHTSPPSRAPVVVGIHGSPASELATAIAFDEASRRHVGLTALHAWSDLDVSEWPGIDWPATQSVAEEVLAERLAGWQERYPDVHVRRVVVEAQPARRLVQEAEQAQLVVVGSRGRGGFAGLLVGSVGETVAQLARVPVMVVR